MRTAILHTLLVMLTILFFSIVSITIFLLLRSPQQPTDTRTTVETESTEEPIVEARPGDESDTYFVTNSTSGSELFVRVVHPTDGQQGEALPTLIFVPGGTGTSRGFLEQSKKPAQLVADTGFTIILFDPEGRGQSEGEENDNGFIGQDGLKAVIEFTSTLEEVDPSQMGIVSFSYGITMASGVLARYTGLSISFLIDWEGPSDRTETGLCDADRTGHLRADCDDDIYWSEREAATFIGEIDVPYLRLQTVVDHVQPNYEHTLKMVNAAVNGNVPWVRLNEEEPNQTYTLRTLPLMLPEIFDQELMATLPALARELLSLTSSNTSANTVQ